MAYDVFISYAKEDKEVALAACDAIEQAGIKCWIAPRDVLASSDWGESIISAITTSQAMLVIFSSNANSSVQIKREVNHAVEKRLPVITFRVEDVEPTGALEYYLDVTHWLDAIDPPLKTHLQRLTEDIKRILKDPRPAPAPRTPPKFRLPSRRLIWIGVALLAVVPVIVALNYITSNREGGPLEVRPSPTSNPVRSPDGLPVAILNTNSDAPASGARATPTPTPTPLPTQSQTQPSDNTDSEINKAVEVLGNNDSNSQVRSNAIFTLEPLAKTSLDRHKRVVRILTSYVQEKAVWREGSSRPTKPIPTDIQAAITVLGRRKWWYKNGEGDERLELTGADLRGGVFRIEGGRAHFEGARLRGAHLDEAILKEVNFQCANLSGASMSGADVDKADFDGADLTNLKGTSPALLAVAWNIGKPKCAH